MLSFARTTAGVLSLLAIAYGLAATNEIGEGQWLALLAGAWFLLIVALWPVIPTATPPFSRATIRTAVVLASVFVLLGVQLVRIQVVRSDTTVERIATDPASGEIIANPRIQIDDLEIDRGSVFDRNGAVLAESVRENGVARRRYPDPDAAYVVGYFSPLLYGSDGLEASYDDELAGRDGNNAIVRGINDLLGRPQQGLDLHLTLDAGLQRSAHQLMAGRPGAAVLLDIQTGAVHVLASNPHYDPNPLFTAGPGERDRAAAYWSTLVGDESSPLLLRATDGRLTPGSTLKVFSAASIIDAGFATPDDVYQDNGELNVDGHIIVENNRPDESRTEWTLREALAWSLNVVFAQVGLELGPDLMRAYAERFGFGAEIPFDLPVTPSQIASSAEYLDNPPGLADTAFGQGESLTNPLHMALIAAAIANHGNMPRPYLVDTVQTSDGDVIDSAERGRWLQPVSEAAAEQTRDLMINAVETGVAQAAYVDGYVVGGKTGTAEVADQEPHAWFIGFIGAPEPRYAVAVVLEHGGAGLAGSLEIGRDLLVEAMLATDEPGV